MRAPATAGFSLRKWYLDCVGEDQSVFIGYSARLRWGPLGVGYTASLVCHPGHPPHERHAYRSGPWPEWSDGRVCFRGPDVGVESSEWVPKSEPLQRTLYRSDHGSVEWICHVPRGACAVTLADGVIRGQGYVEELELTVPPWGLPIHMLDWGRFHSTRDEVTWIRWRGPYPLTVVVHNGIALARGAVTETGVTLEPDESDLVLSRCRTLREGPVLQTLLPALPALRSVMPARVLNLDEHKWLSTGVLRRPDGTRCSGWAVHETVDWS